MGYRVNAENVLRPNSWKKRLQGIAIGLVIVLVIELYLVYNYLSYVTIHGITENTLATASMSFSIIFSRQSFTYNLFQPGGVKQVFQLLFKLWPLNGILLVFMAASLRSFSKFRGVEHGSAKWAGPDERKLFSNPDTTIPVAEGLFVDPKKNDLKNIHEIVIGDTGAGKSFRKLIPDLFQMTGSYVVVDVKGTLYRQTVRLMKDHGYKIKVLNLKDLKFSNTFNPLAYLESDEDIIKLVDTFVYNSRSEGAGTGDQFWEDTMAMLITSIITYLHNAPGEVQTLSRVIDLVTSLEVARGQILPHSEYEVAMKQLELKDPYNTAVMLYKQFKQAAGDTLQSVLISTTSRLKLWNIEEVRTLTDTDELKIHEIVEQKTVLYVIIPASNRTFRVISSMFLSTLFTTLTSLAERRGGGKLPMLLSVEMDEFANCGKINDFDTIITTVRSYNIRVVPFIQSVQQLEKLYEKAEDTILSNCAIYNYLGTSDIKTREDLVKRLGKTTIVEESSSQNVGGRQGGGNLSDRNLGRELMTLDEIGRMDNKSSIVLLDGHSPFYADKFKTEKHPLFKFLGNDDESHPNYANNSDIQKDYAALAAQHKAEYDQRRAAAREARSRTLPFKSSEAAGGHGGAPEVIRDITERDFLDSLLQDETTVKTEIEEEMKSAELSLPEILKNKNSAGKEKKA